jgi:hypothetical protein
MATEATTENACRSSTSPIRAKVRERAPSQRLADKRGRKNRAIGNAPKMGVLRETWATSPRIARRRSSATPPGDFDDSVGGQVRARRIFGRSHGPPPLEPSQAQDLAQTFQPLFSPQRIPAMARRLLLGGSEGARSEAAPQEAMSPSLYTSSIRFLRRHLAAPTKPTRQPGRS